MALLGLLYIILLFTICFAVVHIIKLAAVGFLSLKKKPPAKEEKPEQKPKPVYYIVEKKRARKSYSPPREIEFK
jgi:flagellar basal body-associated protein FliL